MKKDAQDFVFKNARRILKPDGILIIDHQNDLYEMFALNNESIIILLAIDAIIFALRSKSRDYE